MLYTKSETKALSKRQQIAYEKQCVKAEKILGNGKKVAKVLRKARKIFERLHNIPRCDGLCKNICCFCDLLSDYFDGNYSNLPLSTIVALLAGLLYLVLPIDVIADYLPILGYLDDAAVLGFVIAAEHNDIKEYLEWKKQQAIVAGGTVLQNID